MKMVHYKPKALYYRESAAAGLCRGPEISGGSSKRDILSITILFKWSGGYEALKVIFVWFPRISVGSNILSNKRDLSLSRTSCLKVTLMARISAAVTVSLKSFTCLKQKQFNKNLCLENIFTANRLLHF